MPTLVELLRPEFDREMASTRRVLAAVPEEKFGWRPHAKSFTMGRLAGHVAEISSWTSDTLQQGRLALVSGNQPENTIFAPTSHEQLLEKFDGWVQQARKILGTERLLGVSTHNVKQLRAALKTGAADYLAIGQVFATGSKVNPDPMVGLEGVKAARALTRLPLVAIGGITSENGRAVIEAGADSVAVISGLLPEDGNGMAERVRDFLAFLR